MLSIYAISDLHLSFTGKKTMDCFGEHWKDHHLKLKQNWHDNITDDDTVLVAGDISWASKLSDAVSDLEFIDALPGKKILISGNHDYWWDSTNKLNNMFESMFFLRASSINTGNISVCGARGWLCPNDSLFAESDLKPYQRQLRRLKASLDAADKDAKEIIVMLHFPPTNDKREYSEVIDLIQTYNVSNVIYGHLHDEQCFNLSYIGKVPNSTNGGLINYHLTSCDYLNFYPKKIL